MALLKALTPEVNRRSKEKRPKRRCFSLYVIVQANVELLRGRRIQAGNIEIVHGSSRSPHRRLSGWGVALGKLGEKLQRDGIRVGNLVAGKRLPRPVRIVGLGRVIDRKADRRKNRRSAPPLVGTVKMFEPSNDCCCVAS